MRSNSKQTASEETTTWVRRAQAGDVKAFNWIVHCFQDRAVAYAASILGNRQTAEDAAQEAFVEAYCKLPSLRAPEAFPVWLRNLIFKHCNRTTRASKLDMVPLASVGDVPSLEADIQTLIESRELQEEVHLMIQSLSAGQRAVITLFYMGRHSHAEIAEFLSLPVSTVKSRLHEGRSRLKGRMFTMIESDLYASRPSRDEGFSQETLAVLLQEQVAYYRARAGEYDQWFLRQGRYDRGSEVNAPWFAEVDEVRAVLDAFVPKGRVLELACGTGLWTQQIARHTKNVTAVDAAPEMLSINRAQTGSDTVRYVQADILNWQPADQYDVVFFGFWLSHVPAERFDSFWSLVRDCLAPGGRVFFVDSLYEPTSTASGHYLTDREAVTQTRLLNDGREFSIFKTFYESEKLAHRLEGLGWQFDIRETEHYFLYAHGKRCND